MIDYKLENGIATLTWNMVGYPMNILNKESIALFSELVDKTVADEQVKGVIITSAKRDFMAGADLNMLLELFESTKEPQAMFDWAKSLNTIYRKYEVSGKPFVAALNGTTLGGGFEMALACHYRVVLNNPKAKLGLPEAKLGLLPGAGGTQRVARMIGIEAAAPLLMEGKTFSPEKALKAGLINELVDTPEALITSAIKYIEENPTPIQPWDEKNKKGKIVGAKRYKVPKGNVQSPRAAMLFMPGTALMMGKTWGNYPAQLAIMNCVYEGLQVPMELALKIESRYFTQLLLEPKTRNMIRTLFFGINDAKKGSARPKDVEKTDIKKIGILGAGMMGAGIAYVSAKAGLEVVLKDVSIENAEKGKKYSQTLTAKGITKGKETKASAEALLNLIKPTDKVEDLADCDLIIEAVFENMDIKAKVTKETEAVMKNNAVFGSNTSTLPITGLAKASVKPENFIGIHFFSPVDKMQLVEVIMGKETSDYALALTLDYIKKIKKVPVVVQDSRGFYTSRCFGTYTSEGGEMVKEGINPVLIENAGNAAGMPVGPLDVADAVALDLAYKVMKQTEEATGEKVADMTSGEVIEWLVKDQERFGKKNGKGFYAYPEKGKKHIWEGLNEKYPLAEKQPDIEALKKRLLHRQAIEAVRCLEEGVLRNPTDGDVGSILAWGFAPYSGGVFSYIDWVGLDTFVKECDTLADQYGERFRPTDKLREMAKEGKTFY